jgi:hypothetical protein
MYLVFAYGGIPFFETPKPMKIFFVLLSGAIFIAQGKKFDKNIAFVLSYLLVIFIAQTIIFGGGTFLNVGLLFIIILIPYFVTKIVGENFTEYYINITFVFACIGLLFYFASVLSPAFHDFTATLAPRFHTDPTTGVEESFIIYTYERYYGINLRSPGPFWEPGAYAVFLIVALVFNIIRTNKLLNLKSIIIILALLTTFSTAGYIALFIFLIFYLITSKIKIMPKILILTSMIILTYNLYFYLDFLNKKISSQYSVQSAQSLKTPTDGRFLGARKSLVTIANPPFFGRGLAKPTQANIDEEEAGGYGFLNLASRVGLIGCLLYFYWVYVFLKQMCIKFNYKKTFALFALVSILCVLFAQEVYDRPIFLMMMLTPLITKGIYSNRLNLQ